MLIISYVWQMLSIMAKALKDKKCELVLNAFIEIVNESNNKSNKLWARQGRELYKNNS